jgi:hypothetical protein
VIFRGKIQGYRRLRSRAESHIAIVPRFFGFFFCYCQGVKHLSLVSVILIVLTLGGQMKSKKIFIKGEVEKKLKRDFVAALHDVNKAGMKKGVKAISQGKFMEILVAEGLNLKDGKRSSGGMESRRPSR